MRKQSNVPGATHTLPIGSRPLAAGNRNAPPSVSNDNRATGVSGKLPGIDSSIATFQTFRLRPEKRSEIHEPHTQSGNHHF